MAPQADSDTTHSLTRVAARYAPTPRRVWVAFSGGPDSTLLLARAAAVWPKRRVTAVHIHHGWHNDADDWAHHCRRTARALGVRCRIRHVDASANDGQGPEAAAREARYRALAEWVERGDVLLTAHHRDDQAETVLLALLRGGGVHGWAAMPVRAPIGSGIHLRPWLELPREHLRNELDDLDLDWLQDPANSDARYDRVWLRQQVLPRLRERWSGVDGTLARASADAGDAAATVDAMAAHDFAHCRGLRPATLELDALLALPPPRQRALLRCWFVREGLPRPPAARLESLRAQMAEAGADRCPRVAWPGGEARVWGGLVWALAPLPPVEPGSVFPWHDRSQPLALPHGPVRPEALNAIGLALPSGADVAIAMPAGGERLRPVGAARAEPLRELLRRAQWPPWWRKRAPLVYVNGRLVGVIGYARAHDAPSQDTDDGP